MTEATTPTPTADTPDHGVIQLCDVVLSAVDHWLEGGDHVLRSTEFDVLAADADLRVAVTKFVETAEDLAASIGALTPEEVTKDELDTALMILQRLYDARSKLVQQLRRHSLIRRLRGRGYDADRPWYRRSSLPTSSPLQPV